MQLTSHPIKVQLPLPPSFFHCHPGGQVQASLFIYCRRSHLISQLCTAKVNNYLLLPEGWANQCPIHDPKYTTSDGSYHSWQSATHIATPSCYCKERLHSAKKRRGRSQPRSVEIKDNLINIFKYFSNE